MHKSFSTMKPKTQIILPSLLRTCLVFLTLALSISETLTAGVEDFASKFQQSDYKIVFEFGETIRYNKQELKYFHMVVFKHNRTTAAINLTFEFNFDIGTDLELVVQANRFASNEFRQFPLRFQVNYCYAIQENLAGAKTVVNCGNVKKCSFQKGVRYNFCNWFPDEKHLPPLIPNGKYMLEIQGVYKSTELFVVQVYGSVFRPIVKK